MSAQGLVRICAVSVILSIGYSINFVPILQALLDGSLQPETWVIAYVASSVWLFFSCVIMIIITLGGFKIKIFAIHNYVYLFFVAGVCGYIMSLVFGLAFESENKYICWQFEILYALLPLYLACLIFFFNDQRFTQLINLILFSFMLFVTPFIRLLVIMLFNEFPLPVPLIAACLSICVATSVLISMHITCLMLHYTSGLLLKSSIVALFTYSMITMVRNEIDFEQYQATYRIYYYYASLTALFVMYCCELFIKGAKKVVQVDINPLYSSPSFDIQLEMDTEENKPEYQSIYDLVTGKTTSSISSPKRDVSASYTNPNPNETIDSVIQIFPDFKPRKKNRKKYFRQFELRDKKYINIDRVTDSIAAIVPFYNETASQIHATLRSLYYNFEYIKKTESKYRFTHFNVLLVGDGWFKADISTKRYLAKLYSCCTQFDENFADFAQQENKHNTVILQTRFNKKLCINPFRNDDKKLFLKVTTIIKIDNRKKANSHEWFLGRYGFAEWCKCDYMFFTDAYSTMNTESLYKMTMHMKQPKNRDVVCCTGRARVYTIEQELDLKNLVRETHHELSPADKIVGNAANVRMSNIVGNRGRSSKDKVRDLSVNPDVYDMAAEDDDFDSELLMNWWENYEFVKWWENDIFQDGDERIDILDDADMKRGQTFYKIQDIEYDHRLTINAHLRSCQMFEFEALYGTIGCYLLGGFLPVIPGPCGFYRSKYLLRDEVRGWYFQKINQENDPENIDLVLGNMKLAEDRILTISSILNSDIPVRHSLIPECIFYFDPMPNISQLMKQRRRWLNGSIATVLFVLQKISFSRWNVNFFRRYYVLSLWYMQLLMYLVVSISPALIFTISFEYGLKTILYVILVDDDDIAKERKINTVTTVCMFFAWANYLIFIYFMQMDGERLGKWVKIKKQTVVSFTLVMSYFYGLLTLMGTLMQMVDVIRPKSVAIEVDREEEEGAVTKAFTFGVVIIEVTFFLQSFILAPMVSKDLKTLSILLKTSMAYFVYSPFYVSFFFINAIANIHDLSWGTRPDNEEDDGKNPKKTTFLLLFIVVFFGGIIALAVQPFTQYIYAHIIFFGVLAFPSLYQIFFSMLWLTKNRLKMVLDACKPKKMSDRVEYLGLSFAQ